MMTETTPSRKKALRYRSGPHNFEGVEDEFLNWKLLSYSGRIHAMLEGAKGTPRQEILVHRLNKVIEEPVETFKLDESTLGKYLPKIKKAREGLRCSCGTDFYREHDKIWREEQEA